MSDERPNSLAAQAASWVPPWERTSRPPDREYTASVGPQDVSDEVEGLEPSDEPDSIDQPTESEKLVEANLTEDDDFDEQQSDSGRDEVPAELAPLPGESEGLATVDAPTELAGDPDSPIDIGVGPDLTVPASIEDAAEDAEDDEPGAPVDAPLSPDGDDAGDVFDAAADDDLSDGDDVDLPFHEMPGEDFETGPADDEPVAPAAEPDSSSDEQAGPDGHDPFATGGEPDSSAGGESRSAGDQPFMAVPEPVGDRPDSRSEDGAAAGGGDARGRANGGAVAGAASIPVQGRGAVQGRSGRPGGVAVGADEIRTPDSDLGVSEIALIDEAELRAALEAILLVVDEPVAEMQLAQIMEQPTERVAAMLEDISARYTAAGHGFDLRRAAGGWRLYTRPEYAPYVQRFVLDGQSVRLTQAALETLAVVAYKQPVTRSRISAIRGVNCDGVMRTLATRGLIEECGTEGETGAYLYRTTGLFLEKLGLNSVDQLPPLAPFLPDDVEEVLDASG